MPDSMSSYKRIAIAGAAILAAACVVPKTTMAQAGQNALIGAGAKQLYDELSETLANAIPVKVADSSTNKFVNAVVGHTEIPLATTEGVHAPWLGNPDLMWDRPEEQAVIEFTGV